MAVLSGGSGAATRLAGPAGPASLTGSEARLGCRLPAGTHAAAAEAGAPHAQASAHPPRAGRGASLSAPAQAGSWRCSGGSASPGAAQARLKVNPLSSARCLPPVHSLRARHRGKLHLRWCALGPGPPRSSAAAPTRPCAGLESSPACPKRLKHGPRAPGSAGSPARLSAGSQARPGRSCGASSQASAASCRGSSPPQAALHCRLLPAATVLLRRTKITAQAHVRAQVQVWHPAQDGRHLDLQLEHHPQGDAPPPAHMLMASKNASADVCARRRVSAGLTSAAAMSTRRRTGQLQSGQSSGEQTKRARWSRHARAWPHPPHRQLVLPTSLLQPTRRQQQQQGGQQPTACQPCLGSLR